MYNDKLAEIPLQTLLNKNGIIVIWCTNAPSHLQSLTEDIFPSWGVVLKSKWYWLKVSYLHECRITVNYVRSSKMNFLIIYF